MSGFIVCEIIYQFACRDMKWCVRLHPRRLKGELSPYLPGPIGHSPPKGSPLSVGQEALQEEGRSLPAQPACLHGHWKGAEPGGLLGQPGSLGGPPRTIVWEGGESTRTPSPLAVSCSAKKVPLQSFVPGGLGGPGLHLPPGPQQPGHPSWRAPGVCS